MPSPRQRTAFRAALRETVRNSGLSQREIARRCGVSNEAVSRWMRGIDVPTADNVAKLELALERGPHSLAVHLGYVDAPAATTPAEELARAIDGAEHLTDRDRRLLDVIHETMRDEPE